MRWGLKQIDENASLPLSLILEAIRLRVSQCRGLKDVATMSEHKMPDVVAIMEDIRSRVTQDLQSQTNGFKVGCGLDGRAMTGPAMTGRVDRSGDGMGPVGGGGALVHSEDLRAVNIGHAFSANLSPNSIKSHRPGLLGRLVVGLKRRAFNVLRDSLLRDYFAAEQEFQAHLVRHLNAVTRELDMRGDTIRRLESRLVELETESRK